MVGFILFEYDDYNKWCQLSIQNDIVFGELTARCNSRMCKLQIFEVEGPIKKWFQTENWKGVRGILTLEKVSFMLLFFFNKIFYVVICNSSHAFNPLS